MDIMSFNQKLDSVIDRFKRLGDELNQGTSNPQDFVRISKEYAEVRPIAEAIMILRQAEQEYNDSKIMSEDQDLDQDLRNMAQEECQNLKKLIPKFEHDIKILLLPQDKDAERNAIVEIRAGTGGDEAALFAANLLRMYQRYAERQRWKTEIMDLSETGIGGIKEISLSITGKGVYQRLKFESGVHRVQRVPDTEGSGRIHTSAATVAVLPEVEEIDIVIEEKDLRIDVFRSSGPGGQSVNTTDSAVRITHIPTGIVVSQQDEKSQHKNKAKGMKILRARIYDAERQRQDLERSQARKSQIGTGDRSERIRTYNFPQGRMTDHRINLTLYKLDYIMDGDLDEMFDALIAEDQAAQLSDLE